MLKRLGIGWGLAAAVALSAANGAGALVVANGNDDGPGSLRQALIDAPAGDTITCTAGGNSITVNSPLIFTKPVILDGAGNTLGSNGGVIVLLLGGGASGSVVENLAITQGGQGIYLSGADDVRILNCRIGLGWDDAPGPGPAPADGILVDSAARVRIGEPNQGNVLGGCGAGIRTNGTIRGLVIQGNRIGTDSAGGTARACAVGVHLRPGVMGALVGGDRSAGEGNVISGNSQVGLALEGALGTTVCGNLIGVNAGQTAALPNDHGLVMSDAVGNIIGRPLPNYENVIAGNLRSGAAINTLTASSVLNVLRNNYIGVSALNRPLGNDIGLFLDQGADGNVIGGVRGGGSLDRNVVAGNRSWGVSVLGDRNRITGNLVGTDDGGTIGIGNGDSAGGMAVAGSYNLIGGAQSGPGIWRGNVFSGNELGLGVVGGYGNSVAGNYIGLDGSGTSAIPNGYGVLDQGQGTIYGSTDPAERNVISGNTLLAMAVSAPALIRGNYFGTNAAGDALLANAGGNLLLAQSSVCLVGGTTPGSRNLFAGGDYGLAFLGEDGAAVTGNTVVGNWFGVLADRSPAPPVVEAILVSKTAYGNAIGLRGGQGNLIYGGFNGITVDGAGQTRNGLYGNTICGFSAEGIFLYDGGNLGKAVPYIAYADSSLVSGNALAGDYVEVFRASRGAGQRGGSLAWLGAATADGSGRWVVAPSALAAGEFVCATGSDANHNTSGFSLNALVSPAPATPTPTVTPTPTATPTPRPIEFGGRQVLAFPNPGSAVIHFAMNLDRPAVVRVSIYNLLGERVAVLNGRWEESGTLDWNCADAAMGVYLARVEWDGRCAATLKVAVTRK